MISSKLRKVIIILIIAVLSIGVVGCSNNKGEKSEKANAEVLESNFESVKFVYSDGAKDYDVKVESPREKAVTLSQFMTEMLLALGLEDKIIRTALLDNPILPEFEEAYNKIPVLEIGEGHSVSKESFIALGADFVSGWDQSISEETTGGPSDLIEKDIIPFMVKSYEGDATVETVYEDFELLGKIFGVQDKAEEVIDKMKKDIKVVTDKALDIKEEDKVRMMVYDSGENNAMVVGAGLANNLIDLAGGNNIFGRDTNKPYINVTWESIVSENPEVILVTDYMAGSPVQEKIDFLKTHPALKDVPAIKNNKIYVVGLADLSPGIRNTKFIKDVNGYLFGENN